MFGSFGRGAGPLDSMTPCIPVFFLVAGIAMLSMLALTVNLQRPQRQCDDSRDSNKSCQRTAKSWSLSVGAVLATSFPSK